MRKFLSLFLLVGTTLFGSELTLKEKLKVANPGSYLILEQNKTYTFLHIHDVTQDSVVIEEVSVPAANIASGASWKEWFEKGAPGHTSWVISQVNLKNGSFEETYSFTHQGWIDLSDSDPFFTTLLNLQFYEVPENERRRVGRPGFNKTEIRPIWNPRLIVDGRIIADAPFQAFKARWPADGTELSRKVVEIYLPCPREEASKEYPLYFPYWLEVDGRFNTAKVRVVDSGTNASSPKKSFPKRPLQLLGEAKISDLGLHLEIKSASYYHDFFVLAEDNDSFFGNLLPLPCQTAFQADGVVSLFVPRENLAQLLTEGSSYTFVISPKEDPTLTLNTKLPLKLKKYCLG